MQIEGKNKMYTSRQRFGLFLGPVLFLLILMLPLPAGLKPEGLKVAAVTILMATWWITEAIPIPATALLPIGLFPALNVMKSGAATAPYANHLIFLFLGGFFIAIAMEKWKLHRRIALHTIRLVGTSSSRIILGFMIATAFLSMWISNTATTMMMMPIGLSVINKTVEHIKKHNVKGIDTTPTQFRFGSALMLGIAYAASIGGVATIIGTPPNTILVGFIEKLYHQQVSFSLWMAFGVPLAVIMLAISWFYLVRFALPPELKTLPGGKEHILQELKELGSITKAERRVLIVFVLVAMAWIIRGFIKLENLMIHDATIAMLGASLLFVIPADFKKGRFLLDWKSAVRAPWDVIILFGGGLSLANAFSVTGLADWIGGRLHILQGMPLIIIIFVVIIVAMLLTEVTSNTATTAMLIPVMAGIAVGMAVHPFGLMIAAAVASSYAFMLPVATPPNAIVFGSKQITIPQMMRVGIVLDIIGSVLITFFLMYVIPLLWGINMHSMPQWLSMLLHP